VSAKKATQAWLPRLLPDLGVGLVLDLASRLRWGRLEVHLPDGVRRFFTGAGPGPEAVLLLRDGKAAKRVVTGGGVGFAEGYMAREWDSPDLASLLELVDRNCEAMGFDSRLAGLRRLVERTVHAFRLNSRSGSRKNIQAHYDLGNRFYEAWLDPTLTYSSALFGPDTPDLQSAQLAKYRRLAERIALAPGQRLLEIGTGWGGFALTAAKEFGARVTGITVSKEQQAYASQRVFREGLADRVEIRLQDYRDVAGRFDRIASIEMLEAVGERFWPLFFGTLRDRLVPGGQAGVQTITIADRLFDEYRHNVDFIQKYIFPGGMLPSPAVLRHETAQAGLQLESTHFFGHSYARTLAEWHRRFDEAWPRLEGEGFDERFRRMWKYYLAYCEAGFRSGSIDVTQVTLRPA
jgi:cyclopropane-fatty-acyl-phospholipid synthase